MQPINENDLSKIILGCAIEVHKQLGPGLLESAYRECLSYELTKAGLEVQKEKPMPIIYKEVKLDHGYRIDLLVNNKVVIEVKVVEAFTDVHTAQVLTYLKSGNYKLGLLLKFLLQHLNIELKESSINNSTSKKRISLFTTSLAVHKKLNHMKFSFPMLMVAYLQTMLMMGCLGVANRNQNENKINKDKSPMNISRQSFGKLPDGQEVDLYTLTNQNGMQVCITNFGGVVTHLMVPRKDGSKTDVVLGYDSLAPYLKDSPYFGAIVGRYGNRIAKGRFNLDGKTYTLATNNGPNHLHGGIKGFDKVLWTATPIEQNDLVGLQLEYFSPDGEEGYPGNLQVKVQYLLTNDHELKIDYQAETDKPTPVNITHHSYFNLDGAGTGSILNHCLMIDADRYVEVDQTLIPTGLLKPVENTPMDFRIPRAIGEGINDIAGGYDHTWVLNNNNTMALIASLENKDATLQMDIYTSEPGVQFYSGNFLDGSIKGKNGLIYEKHYGLCLETQHFPDSPNQPAFPNTILRPGQKYAYTTIYKFISR